MNRRPSQHNVRLLMALLNTHPITIRTEHKPSCQKLAFATGCRRGKVPSDKHPCTCGQADVERRVAGILKELQYEADGRPDRELVYV